MLIKKISKIAKEDGKEYMVMTTLSGDTIISTKEFVMPYFPENMVIGSLKTKPNDEDRINHEHKASPKETAATILKHIDGHEKMLGGTKNIIESEKYTDPEYTEGEVISNIASLQPDAML